MPGSWFDQFGDEALAGASYGGATAAGGYVPYEQGGYGGPASTGAPVGPEVNAEMPAEAAPFNPQQQVGHNGAINGMNREQYRDAWMSSGVNSVQGAKDFISKHGGTWQADNGQIMTPFGESMDMVFNARGSAAGNGEAKPIWGGGGGGPAPGGQGGPGGGSVGPAGGGYGGFGGFGGGGGGGGGARSYNGPAYQASAIDLPQNYSPTATAGPERYRPDQIQGPAALTAQQVAGADPFHAPSADDLYADPSFKFRQEQGQKAFMANKAAAGVARTGGALQQLADYNQQAASQEYGNVYNRKFGEYQTSLADRLNVAQANNGSNAQAYGLTNQYQQQAAMANQGANLQAWNLYNGMNQQNQQFNAGRQDNAAQQNFANRFNVQNANNANNLGAFNANVNSQLGFGNLDLGYTRAGNDYSLGMGNLALGNKSADQSYDLGLRNNALGYYGAGNSYNLGLMGNQLGWANYGLNADQQQFGQGYSLANLGLQSAGLYGNYAGQYGQNAGNNATGAGNATAAGQVGSANAWNQGLGNAVNGAMGAYGLYLAGQYPNQPTGHP